jgi:hypothetical protein
VRAVGGPQFFANIPEPPENPHLAALVRDTRTTLTELQTQ